MNVNPVIKYNLTSTSEWPELSSWRWSYHIISWAWCFCPAGHLDALLRGLVLGKLGKAGHKPTLEEARRRFRDHVDGKQVLPADLRSPVSQIKTQHSVLFWAYSQTAFILDMFCFVVMKKGNCIPFQNMDETLFFFSFFKFELCLVKCTLVFKIKWKCVLPCFYLSLAWSKFSAAVAHRQWVCSYLRCTWCDVVIKTDDSTDNSSIPWHTSSPLRLLYWLHRPSQVPVPPHSL